MVREKLLPMPEAVERLTGLGHTTRPVGVGPQKAFKASNWKSGN